MPEKNGNNKWTMYLVSVLIGIVVFGAIPSMASWIAKNRIDNEEQHNDIKTTMIERDEDTIAKVNAVKDIVTDIRLEQRTMSVEQKTIMRTLSKIEKKL